MPLLMLSQRKAEHPHYKDAGSGKALILQQIRSVRAGPALCSLLDAAPPSTAVAAEPGPVVWPGHPCVLLEAISALSLHHKANGSWCCKTQWENSLKHIPTSLQFLKLHFKPPVCHHCISLIIDFQQRLTCNRRANCALAFRDCSFPAGNPGHRWQNEPRARLLTCPARGL